MRAEAVSESVGEGSMKRVGDLEIDQDLAFERRQWSVQRVGWGVGALIIVAALLGCSAPGR